MADSHLRILTTLRKNLAPGLFVCALSAATAAAWAQLPKLGSETPVHAATTANEHEASCAMDAFGNYVVAYSHTDASSNSGIAVQRYNRRGEAQGTVFVPHTTAGVQQQPAVAMGDDGRFVVVWEDNQLRGSVNYDVYFALYNAAGTKVAGPTKVNTTDVNARENARVAMNRSTGEFVVAWSAAGASTSDVYARRFNATGAAVDPLEVKVNTSINSQDYAPSVAFSGNGTYIVAWEGNPNGDLLWEAYFQRYNFAGTAVSPIGGNTVASAAGRDVTEVEVACDDAGNYVLAWVDGLPNTSTHPKDLIFRRYDGGGFPTTPTTVFKVGAFSGNGDVLVPRIRVAMENDDDFAFVYVHDDEIWTRFYTGTGAAKAAESKVNTTTNATTGEFQSKPWIALNPRGNRGVITWHGTGAADNNGVHFQRYAEANQAPTLAAIGDKSGPELQSISFTAAATESLLNFGDTVTYSLDAGAPAGATISAATGNFSWTPTEAQGPGSYSITIRATDNGEPAMSDFETITVNVSEVNLAPTNITLSNSTVAENVNPGTTIGTLTTTDADLPAQTFTYAIDPALADGAQFNLAGNTLAIQVSPDYETKNVYNIRVKSTDSMGGFTTKDFAINIQDVTESSVPEWSLY